MQEPTCPVKLAKVKRKSTRHSWLSRSGYRWGGCWGHKLPVHRRATVGRPNEIRNAQEHFTSVMPYVLVLMLLLSSMHLADSQERKAMPNHGQLRTATFGPLRDGFRQPDMIFAPFCFWFWDEPLAPDKYPEKAAIMARTMLRQGINPGYAHPRVSMADLTGPKVMAPSPSLPKDEWLSPKWFDAFGAALREAEAASGYLGSCDEYMWPSGRAAGRVIQKHPELASASLQWEVTDVAGGTQVELPASFFTVAAQHDQKPDPSRFRVPVSTNTFPLVDLAGVDLFGKVSLGQTAVVEMNRLKEVLIQPACWPGASEAKFTLQARLDGPDGRVIASQRVDGGVRAGKKIIFPIPETVPAGATLYVAMIPDPDFPEKQVGWWCKPGDVYAGGTAFLDGKPVAGDRHLELSYLIEPELLQGQWIWQPENVSTSHTCYFRKTFELKTEELPAKAVLKITADNRYKVFLNGEAIGQGQDWSRLGTYTVTPSLRSGRNVIAVEGGGDGGLDALLCDLKMDSRSGEAFRVSSDGTWRCSAKGGDDWNQAGFDDGTWQAVRVLGPADAAPWNLSEARLPYLKASIRSATLRLIGSGDKFQWTAPQESRWWRVYTFKKILGGDVNCIDERLAAAFVEIAHKPYAEHFGNRMGKSIPGVFCDTEGNYGNGNGLVWSDSLAPRYRTNTGRDVRLWVPLMLDDDVEGLSARARFDWFDAVSDLYAGYYAGITDWLADRGMYHIANVWEESLQWQASCVSDHMKVQRAFTMPGTDCLGLKAYDIHDFKETQSVSEFENRRVQSEIMGAGGWSTFNPITIKECVNSVVAWGINHVAHHGVFMTRVLEGNVWTPDWYDENPMWSNMRLWADFTRRASYVNSHGHVNPDVLLLNPMESVWALLGQTDKLWWSPVAGHVGYIDELYSKQVQDINTVYSDAMRLLSTNRVEYLIADRHYVKQMRADGPELVRGEFRFKTVVLPPLAVLPLDVARKIVDFAQAGGRVYTLGSLPTGSTDNGLHDPAMGSLMRELQAQATVKTCPQGLKHELEAKSTGLESPIQFVSGEFPMLQLRRRIDNRDFFWLVNNSHQARQCEVQAVGVGGGASVWDCETGEILPVASAKKGNGSRLQLAFEPHQAYWLVFDPKQSVRSRPVMALPEEQALLAVEGPWSVRIDSSVQPNLEHEVKLPESLTGPGGATHDLTLWETWKEIPAQFSGLVDYSREVTLPRFKGDLVLDLGKVHHFAEVWVNGKWVGAKLWPPHKFTTDAFQPGKNKIRVRVGNLVNNNYKMPSPSGLLGPVSVKTVAARN